MNKDEEQKILHAIVETWQISEKPEYRGFRCAHCQNHKNEAWHHWIHRAGYKLPVHLCHEMCKQLLHTNSLQIHSSKRYPINRNTFGTSYTYTDEAKKRFREIVDLWEVEKEPKLKVYTCDECNEELDIDSSDGIRKGFHVWWKMEDTHTLVELHFHKHCAAKFGIEE